MITIMIIIMEELFAAELLRDVRGLGPQALTDAVDALSRLLSRRPMGAEIFGALAQAFEGLLPSFPPRQLVAVLCGLVRAGHLDPVVFDKAGHQVMRQLLGLEPKDVSLALWAFAKASHVHAPLFSMVVIIVNS